MMFWIAAAILTLLSAAALSVPIFATRRRAPDQRESALAIFTDQLAEVDRDAERGLISGDEAKAARVEIKRRMLAADRQNSPRGDGTAAATGKLGFAAMSGIAILGGLALYANFGNPGIPSVPIAERTEERQNQAEITELTQRLRTRLEADEGGGPTEGWLLLGQTYMRMTRYSDAVYAFGQVIDRADVNSGTLSMFGEALVASDNGVVTPRAEDAFRRALDIDPDNVAATYYLALGLEQTGELDQAFALLEARVARNREAAPWIELFVGRANAIAAQLGRPGIDNAIIAQSTLPPIAAPGPDAGDIAAAAEMSDEERAAFVQSMVARLSDRLEQEPDDLDGWLRLGRAHMVLGHPDQAREAYISAKVLTDKLAADDPRRVLVEQALQGEGQ